MGETDLQHKILASWKRKAPRGQLRVEAASIRGGGSDRQYRQRSKTGAWRPGEYHVQGPTTLFIRPRPWRSTRSCKTGVLTLTVDESKEQTERIHAMQRKARTLEGLVAKEERKDLLRVLKNAQRLLRPLTIENPWADDLTFTVEQTVRAGTMRNI